MDFQAKCSLGDNSCQAFLFAYALWFESLLVQAACLCQDIQTLQQHDHALTVISLIAFCSLQ